MSVEEPVREEPGPEEPVPEERPRASGRSIRRWVARSASANLLSRGIAVLVAFVMTPYILGHLGPSTYGLWVLAGAIVGYAGLLDLGVAGALTKYVAEHRERDEWSETNALIATSLRLYALMGIVIAGLGLVAGLILPPIFGIPPSERETATRVIALLALGVAIAIPATTSSAILKGLGRYDLVAAIRIVGSLVGAASTILVIELGYGVVGMAATNVPVTLLTFGLGVVCVRRVAPRLRIGVRGADRRSAGSIASFSAPLVILEIGGRLQSESDEIVIGAFMPLAAITPFALAARVSSVASLVTDQFASVLLPLASSLEAANEHRRLQEAFLTGTRLTIALFVPIGLGLAILGGPFLSAWVGPAYASAAPIVVILTLSAGIDMAMWPAGFVLQGLRRHHRLGWLALGSGLANLALSIVLIGPLGITGVAIGTLVPTTIECFLFVMPFALSVLGIGGGRAFREVVVPTALPAIPALVVLVALRLLLEPGTLVGIALVGLAGLAVYGGTYLLMTPARQERELLADVWRALVGRVGRARA
jgi:O-antigen/teichoic acid export membrane protein